jgi:ABC-type transport system involved in Fe-S cluster assembly fused permease/ATPase subunit
MADRTTIVIAHRTSTLATADMIVALEDSAHRRGRHSRRAVASQRVYSRFYRRQLLTEQLQRG